MITDPQPFGIIQQSKGKVTLSIAPRARNVDLTLPVRTGVKLRTQGIEQRGGIAGVHRYIFLSLKNSASRRSASALASSKLP
jgi:hypothetical protein